MRGDAQLRGQKRMRIRRHGTALDMRGHRCVSEAPPALGKELRSEIVDQAQAAGRSWALDRPIGDRHWR
jgi:hypothetical protein